MYGLKSCRHLLGFISVFRPCKAARVAKSYTCGRVVFRICHCRPCREQTPPTLKEHKRPLASVTPRGVVSLITVSQGGDVW